jgi:hypothetical protein
LSRRRDGEFILTEHGQTVVVASPERRRGELVERAVDAGSTAIDLREDFGRLRALVETPSAHVSSRSGNPRAQTLGDGKLRRAGEPPPFASNASDRSRGVAVADSDRWDGEGGASGSALAAARFANVVEQREGHA